MVPVQVSSLHHSALSSSAFQWFGFSSSASPEPNDKETGAQSGNEKENKAASNQATAEVHPETVESISDEKSESGPDWVSHPIYILDCHKEYMY